MLVLSKRTRKILTIELMNPFLLFPKSMDSQSKKNQMKIYNNHAAKYSPVDQQILRSISTRSTSLFQILPSRKLQLKKWILLWRTMISSQSGPNKFSQNIRVRKVRLSKRATQNVNLHVWIITIENQLQSYQSPNKTKNSNRKILQRSLLKVS